MGTQQNDLQYYHNTTIHTIIHIITSKCPLLKITKTKGTNPDDSNLSHMWHLCALVVRQSRIAKHEVNVTPLPQVREKCSSKLFKFAGALQNRRAMRIL